MTIAQSILTDVTASVGSAQAHLVRAEGNKRAGAVKFRELALDSLCQAKEDIERALKQIEADLYQPAGGDAN